jgi:carbon monoxide dehydrogenase subunit G
MASIIKQIEIDAPADAVWDAVSDFGAVHRRFAPGFVTNVELIPGARMVTFGNGLTVKELFLGVDHERRRLAYSVAERFAHHSASFQVDDLGDGRSRLTWTADVLPDEVAASTVAPMMEQGIQVAKDVLGRVPA